MDRHEAETLADRLLGEFQVASADLESAVGELERVKSEIREKRDDIGWLKSERRGLRGPDRDYLTTQIDSAYDDLSCLHDRRHDASDALRQCKREVGATRSSMKRLVGRLRRVVEKSGSGAPRIVVGGGLASASGFGEISQAYDQAGAFAVILIQTLQAALDGSGHTTATTAAISFAEARPSTTNSADSADSSAAVTRGGGGQVVGATAAGDGRAIDTPTPVREPLLGIEESFLGYVPEERRRVAFMTAGQVHIETVQAMEGVEEPHHDVLSYNIVGSDGALVAHREVPLAVFELPKDRWDAGDRRQEDFGVETAMAWMAARGRRAIVAIGGPGRPDVLSLTHDGQLVRSEVKGTFSGTSLGAAGLFRPRIVSRMEQVSLSLLPQIWDGNGPANDSVKVAENSRSWIAISAGSVLKQLDQLADQVEDSGLRTDYMELADRFRTSYLDGRFVEEGSEVIQVGQGEELPDPSNSIVLHQYCEAARPSQIIQINVEG